MNINVQSIHFEATEQLHAFIEKKVGKFAKNCDEATADVVLKVVKPETAMNKEVQISLVMPGGKLFAEKTCDTFEEAVDLCCEALKHQFERFQEKRK